MKTFSLAVNALRRDWRSGELRLIAIAVVIAVASFTSVSFFTDRVLQATELQSAELLAADLVLLSGRAIDAGLIERANAAGLISSRTTSFRSIVIVAEKLQMAEVKAIEDGYPVRGHLRISNTLFGEESITTELPAPGTVWVDVRLLQILNIEPGDQINLGASQLTVSKVLTYEPDRGGDLFNIAPRLLMNMIDVPATELILPGSRVQYRLLLGGKLDAIKQFRQMIESNNEDDLKIHSIRDARPELKSALERAEQFLGLAALVSIALAGLAVAMSAQRYAIRHFDNCAIMRCLGAEQSTITNIYFIQLLILSVISSLAGCGIGYIAQHGLSALMSGLTPEALPAPSLLPVATGLLTGIITVLGFAMPQILRLRNVSPLRVLRRDLAPLPLRGITTYVFAVVALALLTPWQSGNIHLTVYMLLGIFVTGLILTGSARLMIRWLNHLRSRVGVAARYGLANIARRKTQRTGQYAGRGMGGSGMLRLKLMSTDLLESWSNRLPEGTPNYFLINIQPDEIEMLQAFMQQHAALTTDIYPMIRGRLTAINGKAVNPNVYKDQRAQRLVSREFNLSWARDLQAGNRLAAGNWWSAHETDNTQFSVEQGIAETLGINLHDKLTYSIAGQDITGEVTNLRWVEWDSFNVNFFVIANPGKLEKYPGTYITSFYLAADKKKLLIDLVKTFPSVTVVDIDALLSQVRIIMQQVIKTIEFVFGFTLLAGLIVMFAALQTTHDERIHESALLSALGANRHQILASLIAEFLCLGLVAGVSSAFSATVVALALAEFVFKMDVFINPWVWLIAPLICSLVIVLGGLAGTRKVFNTAPMVALRKI